MTRFLSGFLQDPRRGTLNDETHRLFDYHQATKHTYDSVRSGARALDWKNQPNPFRTYQGASIIPLPRSPAFPNAGTFATISALAKNETPTKHSDGREQIVLDRIWLSSLLWNSMAVSAWKKAPRADSRYSLRVNPSSGNLHPTETHLALRGFADIEDGLYHYRADQHALELRGTGDHVAKISRALKINWAASANLTIGLTSIFWREAWKYRDRAYRYCCHDMGHAMMSLLLSAHALGLAGGAIAHFGDAGVADALGVAGSDEAPMTILVFPSHDTAAQPRVALEEAFAGAPNELSPDEISYDVLLEMHRATMLPDSCGPAPDPAVEFPHKNSHDGIPKDASTSFFDEPSVDAAIRTDPARDSRLGEVVRRRRSALDFDSGAPPMDRRDAEHILDFATRDWRADWRGNFPIRGAESSLGADFVTLYLYVHRVQGCEPGVYRWDARRRALTPLHRGNVQRVAAFLSLEQSLAGNSCFTISMIADLAAAARVFGNRGYRYVYFEAGSIGQRLYLGAEALHWNATGIGAFYDDDVHRYLGFLEDGENAVAASLDAAERASLVHLGSPASRHAAERLADSLRLSGQTGIDGLSPELPKDSKTLPRQVIYHFAIGRAISDPRIED